MKIKLLDCTLRDGGYYNNWDFNDDLVSDYLSAIADSGTDYVELGLRQFSSDSFLGASAFTTHQYLNRLNLPVGPEYGVMIDAKTILSSVSDKFSHEAAVDVLFKDMKDEYISLVRVAAHFDELKDTPRMLNRLKEKGYKVGLNIMQSSLRSSDELSNATKEISRSSSVDVLYFADSLGSMDIKDVERVFEAIRKEWNGEIGFHSHNNMGQALENVNKAIEIGASWIDGTISGMGRGAGNAETEYLLANTYLQKDPLSTYKIFNLVSNHFAEMKKKCGWGPSLEYFYGAKFGIHPTYIQELCADKELDKDLIFNIIKDIGKTSTPHKFTKQTLDLSKSSLSQKSLAIKGKKVPKFMKNKDVLFIAQTNSTLQYKEAIKDYISAKNPIVISINQPNKIIDISYDYVAISHNQKYRSDHESYLNSNSIKYIAPKGLFEVEDKSLMSSIEHNYGISISNDSFEILGDHCIIPYRLTLAYAIAFCIEANASQIYLAGFQGYDDGNPKQKIMQNLIHILTKKDISLCSLTPTKYSIKEKSIFDLL